MSLCQGIVLFLWRETGLVNATVLTPLCKLFLSEAAKIDYEPASHYNMLGLWLATNWTFKQRININNNNNK
jgi:hypothetical protein